MLPVEPTEEEQVQRVLATVLTEFGRTNDPFALQALSQALQALAQRLSKEDVPKASEAVLMHIGRTTEPYPLQALAQTLLALPHESTEGRQVQDALQAVLEKFRLANDPYALRALSQTLQALAPRLSKEDVSKVLEAVLMQIGRRTDPSVLLALAQTLHVLPIEIADEKVQQTLDHAINQVGEWPGPFALPALAQLLQAMPARPPAVQTQHALSLVIEQMDQATEPEALLALGHALQTLAPMLSNEAGKQAVPFAAASLAWAATDDEAADWARALVALSQQTFGPDEPLVAAITYPTAAGAASDILLDELRRRHPEIPGKEAGMYAALDWLMKSSPRPLYPPACPLPPHSFDSSGLRCPLPSSEARGPPSGN